jgi:hypothetical protein
VNRKRYWSFFASIFFVVTCAQAFVCGRTVFVPRAQDDNIVRRMKIEQLRWKDDHACYSFRMIPEYTRSFRPCKIAQNFFGGNTLVFSGSRVANRSNRDILADYLGLPSDFVSRVSFCPLIQNFLIDWGLKINLDWWHDGVYLDFWAPLVHTRWNLRMCERVTQKGELFSPAGYLSGGNTRLQRDQLPTNVTSVFQGGVTFGDMQDPLRFGKICGTQTKTEIASIRTRLGWNFVKKADYRIGAQIFITAPTGNRRRAEYLFEPIVGNDHHCEVGFGLCGSWEFWRDETVDQSCSGFAKIDVAHLISSWQRRSFDLKKSGRGSRYMLMMSLDTPRDDILRVPAGVVPSLQYTGHLFHAINKTTLDCKISISARMNLLFGLSFHRNAWSVDLGYNLWGRSSEKLKCRQCFEGGKFAVKGDAQLYGFFVPGPEMSVPLNGTQSTATIYAGQLNGNANFRNQNVDNPAIAQESDTSSDLEAPNAADSASLGIAQGPVRGSNLPILLGNCDIYEASALSPRAFSSKLFARCHHIWKERENWLPYVGLGLEVEFGHSCRALSQVGIWLEGGFLY